MDKKEFDYGWLVGFIESEGVFTKNTIKIRRKNKFGVKYYRYVNPAFYLVSRDRSALEVVKRLLGVGKINRHGTIFHLDVRRKDESIRLVGLLQGKLKSELRARQFGVWKDAVMEWKSRAWGAGADRDGTGGPSKGEISQGF